MDTSRWFGPAVSVGVLNNILGMALPFVVAPHTANVKARIQNAGRADASLRDESASRAAPVETGGGVRTGSSAGTP